MSTAISTLFGAGGGGAAKLVAMFMASGTWTAPKNGIVEIHAIGAGGSGAIGSGASCTGGYSGAYGIRYARVASGAAIGVTVGAGGAIAATGAGVAGGDTIITVGGSTYTAKGGFGGSTSASGVVPTMPTPVAQAGWDRYALNVRPGFGAGIYTGGAGLDFFFQGNNVTTSASTNASGGGGTKYPSIGGRGGGAMPNGADLMGFLPSSVGSFVYSPGADIGLCFYGGGSQTGTQGVGLQNGNGCGGLGTTSSSASGGPGGIGGGGGATAGSALYSGPGGIGGGGGGACPSVNTGQRAGYGGDGYVCIIFYPDLGAL